MDSQDREEIRWQIQMLLDLSSQSIDTLRKAREGILFEYQHTDKKISEFRNIASAICGFFATLLVSLVAIDFYDNKNFPYIESAIVLAVIGFISYFTINWVILYRRSIKYGILDSKYQEILTQHNLLRTFVSSVGSNLETTMLHIPIIRSFVVSVNDAMLYDLHQFSSKISGLKKPDEKLYQNSYDEGKIVYNLVKDWNLPVGMEALKKFLEEFEKKTKDETKKKK